MARSRNDLDPIQTDMSRANSPRPWMLVLLAVFHIAGCASPAQLPVEAGVGPDPVLPAPETSLIPLVNVVTAKGWQGDAKPVAVGGLTVAAFARDLDHPRWLYVLPNGDVLVAETNSPPRPKDNRGIRGFFFKFFQKQAGGAAPSANRITLLRDSDGDGVAEVRAAFLENLNAPFGMALVGGAFYVANSDAVVRFPYAPGQTRIDAPPVKVMELPAGSINRHWTRNIIASPDGSKLYAAVGSNSNIAENGMENEVGRAAIWELDLATGAYRVFATGLRNPVGMAWEPETRELWTAVNERDEFGSDLVPDYMTSVKDGGFYGWPYSYFGQNVDFRVKPPRPDLVAIAIKPDYALGGHTASLGLCWVPAGTLPGFPDGMAIGQHGSWNRSTLSGYKVIFVPFTAGKPSGMPVDVLTGFVDSRGNAMGRPVGVALDRRGALLVADDVGNVIWRVTASPGG